MIKYTRLFITFLLVFIIVEARAQSTATTSSPYSRYGLGDISNQLFPQNIAMGGIATATSTIGQYDNINLINPAALGKITYTVFDAGFSTNFLTLKADGQGSETNSNLKLSHVAFAIPVSAHSAFSVGLVPYSQVGYSYKQTSAKGFGTGSSVDTNAVNYIYSGEGGLSKAFLGYGFAIGKHLTLGATASYIFGNLQQFQSTEIPDLYGTLDSRVEQDNHVGGFNFDYGAQYTIDFSAVRHLTLGYSASVGNKLNTQNSYLVSQYNYDTEGNQNNPADTIYDNEQSKAKIQLPRINHFGIAYQKEGSFLVGADFTTGNWSDLSIAGVNQGLQNSKMLNVGAEIIPNSNALKNYLALIRYRVGFIYEDTYLNEGGINIKRYAFTWGFGIPLPHDRASSAFYQINFSAEIGKRGTLENNLVQENYANFNLAFTLNDRWFQRFKFE